MPPWLAIPRAPGDWNTGVQGGVLGGCVKEVHAKGGADLPSAALQEQRLG
jgi:hypothetical protein